MREIEVDTESLRRARVLIGDSTQETDAALTGFIAELESFGQPWGDDALGSLIGLSYQGIFEVAMDCFASNLDLIDEYAGHVHGDGVRHDDHRVILVAV